MKKYSLFFGLLALPYLSTAQAQGTLSGDLQSNINYFVRDTKIGASGNPLYDKYLSGSESWLSLRYNVNDWTFTLRADHFNNSNLRNPVQAYTAYGLGAWSITKEMNDLTITGGYIYDQIGSGILFRSYEDRGLLIDNALVGLQLKYKVKDNITLKAFGGQQKRALDPVYAPIIKGLTGEGDFNIGKVHITPGAGILNRTLDETSFNSVIATVNGYLDTLKYQPVRNSYVYTVFNNLVYKNISWYFEGAYKTNEAIPSIDPGDLPLINKDGNIQFTTLNYAKKGFALNLTAKRTENFFMRTSPNESLLNGMLNWQPVVARLRPERLISRYTPPSQDLSEQAITIDGLISPNDVTNYTLTFTHIDRLNGEKLYREGFAQVDYQGWDKWVLQAGIQYMEYNIKLYQGNNTKDGNPIVQAVTPFADIIYKFNDKKSIRFEAQYMATEQDYGSWVYGLIEYNIAPTFSISFSDMYNTAPSYNNPIRTKDDAKNYYSIFTAYTKGPHRFTLAYVKQIAGFNCSGGVCRYEPAFSGVRATITSRF